MPDPKVGAAALVAGLAVVVAVSAALRVDRASEAAALLSAAPGRPATNDLILRLRRTLCARIPSAAAGSAVLAGWMRRAGWVDTPQRLAAGVAAAAAALAVLGFWIGVGGGLEAALPLAVAGAVAPPAIAAQALFSAIRRRRRRILDELAPMLELLSLELSAGGSPMAALAVVAGRMEGALASELRSLLAASQVSGSPPFDLRLGDLGERLQVSELTSLAMVIGTGRDFGSAVTPGVRALAVDLRRAQRRLLIAESRRALNRVLIPAAVGVLLPFMAVLLYPAVTTLASSFR